MVIVDYMVALERHANEIIEAYGQGVPSIPLATRYGASSSGILGLLRRHGVHPRPPHRGWRRLTEGDTSTIVSLYAEGKTIVEIAKSTRHSPTTVHRTLRLRGTWIRARGLRKRTVALPSDPGTLGYLAGLLDGEGNLAMRPSRGGMVGKLSIYNTNHDVMKWLAQWGGKVRWKRCQGLHPHRKPIGIWELYRALDIYQFLTAILPYLIIKREAAQVIIGEIGGKLGLRS